MYWKISGFKDYGSEPTFNYDNYWKPVHALLKPLFAKNAVKKLDSARVSSGIVPNKSATKVV